MSQAYETVGKEELQWWYQHLQEWNGKAIVMMDPDMVIETDASLLGWGSCGHPDWWTVVGRETHDAYQLLGASRRSNGRLAL